MSHATKSVAPFASPFASPFVSPFVSRVVIAIVTTLLVSAVAVACHDATAPGPHIAAAPAIAIPGDSGAPETIFLPPFGPRKHPRGVLDTTLTPTVSICRLVADACSADTVAHFTADSTLPDSLRVTLAANAYVARWRTAALSADSNSAYRITVMLGDTTTGAVDVKIVPDGYAATPADSARYAFIPPRNTTPIRFQIFVPADTLYVITDAGVHGTLASGTSIIRHGASVPYRFQLDSGYTNLLVTVDDQLVPNSGRIRMTGAHVVVASADRRPGVSTIDQPILTAATTLARTPSAAAAQRLLDRIDAVADTADLDQRLRQIEYTVLERQGTSVNAAIDAALDGHTFQAGDGTGEQDAANTDDNPPGTALARLAPNTPMLTPHAALLAPPRDVITSGRLVTPEPMTIGFVNGVLTTPFGALFGANSLARVARATQWGTPVPFDVRLIYNRTGSGRNVADDCTRDIAAIAWALGRNSLVQRLGACLGETGAELAGTIADFAEAGGQLASILANSTKLRPADADSVAVITTRWRDAGRHVILVGHSQGNLMVQQGVARIAATGRYHPATDTTCIGAVSLAAPTSANWPLSSRHLTGLVVESDAILLLGQNHFPQIHTELDDSAAADVLQQMRGRAPMLAGAAVLGWRVRLHSLVDSYLRREPIRTEVQHALANVYHSCALGGIDVGAAQIHLRPGETTTLGATLRDMTGAPLDGSRGLAWTAGSSIDWQQSVSVLQNGTVRAFYVGGNSARAVTRSRTADVGIVVDPLPLSVNVKESLSGYWTAVPGMSSPPADVVLSGPTPVYSDIPAGWGGCGSHQTIVNQGWTALYAHICVARYDVSLAAIPNAAEYQYSIFAAGETSPRSTTRRSSLTFSFDSIGPIASMDDLPGPPLFDRISVTALDAGGHLLASGVTCVHGCAGWPSGG